MASSRKLAQAYYDLAVLLDAGVPILRSLDMLIEGRQGRFKRVFRQIRQSLSQGSSVAESLHEHPRTFPELDRMLVEAAEQSGSLGNSFKLLSQWHELVHRMTRRVQAGLVYPFFLLHFAALVAGLPAFILGGSGVGGYVLEVLRVLMWLYIPVLVVVAFILLRSRAPLLRPLLDFIVLRVPLLGRAIYHLSICRYAKAFGMLYSAGVPITEATERAARATGNVIVAQLFQGGTASVRRGATAGEGFSRQLPAEYRQLWQIGEETGELDKTAAKIADIAGDRTDLLFQEFSRWLPRIVYFIVMGVVAMMIFRLAGQIPSFSGNF